DDSFQRALSSFRRALVLDPAFIPALEHSIQAAALVGDRQLLRELTARYRALQPPAPANAWLYWRAALALGDTRLRDSIQSTLDSLPRISLRQIVIMSEFEDLGHV